MSENNDIVRALEEIESIWKSNKPEIYSRLIWEKEQFDELIESPLFKTVFSEKKLDRKFRDMLKPFIFEKGDKTIYCKFNRIGFDSERATYIFSALTEEMRNVDNAFFSDNASLNSALGLIYKPYTYELSFEGNLPDSFFEDKKEDTWYEVSVRKYKKKEDGKLYGRLSYGASPLDFQAIEAEWQGEVNPSVIGKIYVPKLSQIQKYYFCQKSGLVDDYLKWLFENNIKRHLIVCRMGQANAILGINENINDKRKFIFDVGLPNDTNIIWNKGTIDRKNTGLYDEAKLASFDPDIIFISHWHTDHYKGAFIMPRNIYIGNRKAMWVAPYYILSSNLYNANRLVGYLMKTGRIAFVGDKYQNTNYNIGFYRVNKGNKSDLNHDCILLQLNKTLLPGDCYYDNWPDDYGKVLKGSNVLINQMENVVISHHASNSSCSDDSEAKLKVLFKRTPNKAFACVGHNPWGHPHAKVLKMFDEPAHLGFHDVICTNDDTRKETEFVIEDL